MVYDAELYAKYLVDRALVVEVERKKFAKNLFAEAAIAKAFPAERKVIVENFG